MERAVIEAQDRPQIAHFTHGTVAGVVGSLHIAEREADQAGSVQERGTADAVFVGELVDFPIQRVQCTRFHGPVLIACQQMSDDMQVSTEGCRHRRHTVGAGGGPSFLIAFAGIDDSALLRVEEGAEYLDTRVGLEAIRWNFGQQGAHQARAAEQNQLPATGALDKGGSSVDVARRGGVTHGAQDIAMRLEPIRGSGVANARQGRVVGPKPVPEIIRQQRMQAIPFAVRVQRHDQGGDGREHDESVPGVDRFGHRLDQPGTNLIEGCRRLERSAYVGR